MRCAALVAALLLAPGLADATEVISGRVARVREDPATGRVFVEITPRPATLDCAGVLTANETYVFDADTAGGRALQAQVLSAYTVDQNVGTVQYVYAVGTGNCLTLGSPFTIRFEFLSRVSACAAFPCPAP